MRVSVKVLDELPMNWAFLVYDNTQPYEKETIADAVILGLYSDIRNSVEKKILGHV